MKKHTLDRIVDGQFVFLEHPEEIKEVTEKISEGDIVNIGKSDKGYKFEVLKEETEDMRDKVSNLLEKLKNKK